MPIRVFPAHYQLVYINFDISFFSLISYLLRLTSLLVDTIVSTSRDTKHTRVSTLKAKLRLNFSVFSYVSG